MAAERENNRFARVLLVLAAVVVLCFSILHVSTVRERVKSFIESEAESRIAGSLEIGSLDYRLWLGEATLREVELELEDSALSRLRIERVRLHYRPLAGLAVEAVEPVVVFEGTSAEPFDGPEGQPETRAMLRPPSDVLDVLDVLEVRNGDLRYTDASSSIDARIAPLQLSIEPADGGTSSLRTISLRAHGGGATWSSGALDLSRLRVGARISDERLMLDSVVLKSSAGQVSAEGAITALSPFSFEVEVDYDLTLAPLRPVEGDVAGTATLEASSRGLVAEGRADVRGLGHEKLGRYAGEAHFRLSNDVLTVSTELRDEGDDGLSFDADLALDLAEEAQHVDLAVQSTSLRRALDAIGASETPWDSAFRLKASLTTSRWEPKTLDGEATVTFDDEAGDDLAGTLRVRAEAGTITARTRDLGFPGGRLELTARLLELEELTVRYAADIAELSPTVEPWFPKVADWVEGRIELTGEVAGDMGARELRARARLGDSRLRIRGEPYSVRGEADYENGRLRLSELVLEGEDGGELAATAVMGLESGELTLAGRLEQLDLGPVGRMAAVPVSAEATGRFVVDGSFTRPRPDVTLELSSIAYQDTSFPPVRLEVAAAPQELRARRAAVRATFVGSPESVVDGTLGLAPPYRLEADIELEPLPWPAVTDAFFSLPAEAGVEAAGRLEVSLPLSEPSRLRLGADIERVSAAIAGQELETVPFRLHGDAEAVQIAGVSLRHRDQELLSLEGRLPFDASGDGELAVEADVALEVIEDWIPGTEAAGRARADLTLSGSLRAPKLTGSLRVDGARYVYQGARVDALSLRAEATGSAIRLDSLHAEVLEGRVTADGVLPLPFAEAVPETEARIAFDVTGIDAGSLRTEGLGLEEAIETSISLAGEIRFPGGDISRWRARGELQEILLATEGAVVSLDAKTSWSSGPEGIHAGPIRLVGGDTDLRVAVEASGGEEEAPVLVTADGRLDLVVANVVLPETLFVSGVARLEDVQARIDEGLLVSGTAQLSGVELVMETPPLVVADVSARLDLDGKRIAVEELRGKPGGGALEGSGALALSPRSPGDESLQTKLDLQVEGARLEYPEGFRSQLSANLRFRRVDEGHRLGGDVTIEQAVYDRRFAIQDVLAGALRREALDVAEEPGFLGRMGLRIEIHSERDIVVDNNLGQIQASSDLLVTGTASAPELNGTIRAVAGGTLTFGANAYEIETARVTLTSFPVLPPELDVRARTEAGGRELVLEVQGRLDNLQTTLQSPTDPSLSRADVASLLLTGRTVEGVRGEEGEVLGQQAALYLGSGLASLTEEGVTEALPISSVRLEPTLVGRETDPGIRFSLGQAITEDLFLTYSIGLNDAEKQLWIVDYELPYQLSLRAVRGDGNDYTGGLSQELFFDFYDRERPKFLPEEEPRPEVLEVRLEGELPLEPSEAREAIELEPGDAYGYWNARKDAGELAQRLRDAGYLNARVYLTARASEDAMDGVSRGRASETPPVVVVYDVEPGPLVELVWRGDTIDDELESWARDRFEGYLPLRAEAARIRRGLTYRLMSEGYYNATVEAAAVFDDDENTARVEIDVELGRRGKDVFVDFHDNASIEDETLLRVLPEPSTPEFFDRIVGHPQEVREELRLLYASRGFLNAHVGTISTQFGAHQEHLSVAIEVDEGEPFHVRAIELHGAASLEVDRLRELLELEEGERFFLDTYLGDRRRLASFYRREGFPEVSVTGNLRPAGGGVAVDLHIDEGPRTRVGDIVVEGARATNESVIEKAVTFEPGDPVRLSDMTRTQSRLYDLQIFRSVNVSTLTSDDGQEDETVLIEVTELPDVRLGYGLRYTTDDQLEVTGDVQLPNVLGGGRQLTLSTFISGSREIYRTNLQSPYFFGIDVATNVFVERELEEADTFDADSWTLTFQQSHPLAERVTMQWGASYNRGTVRERETTGPFAFDVRAARTALNLSFISDTRNSLTRPTRGLFWTASAEYAPEHLGSDFNFVKFFGQLFVYRPLTSKLVWASSYRAGIATGFDQVLLPDTRFRAGGPNSVRGFPVNELGDPDPLLGTPVGGEGIVVMNQELRFPIFWRFGGVTFYDAGNVYLEAADFDPLELRHSVGAALTVELPVGLLSIDWARLLNPPERLDDSRFHISFGYAF